MDPITAAIIAAVAAGVTAGATDVGKQALVDAYNGFKALLKRKFGEHSEVVKAADGVEARPDSEGRKTTLKEEVAAAKADQDSEVISAAQALLEKIKTLPGGPQIVSNLTGIGNVAVIGTGHTVTVTTTTADPTGKKN